MLNALKYVFLILIAVLGLLAFGHVFLEHSSVLKISQVFRHYDWVLMVIHYGIVTIMLILWPYFVRFVGKHQHWPPQTITYLSRQRLALLGFFIIVDLLFVYNTVGHVVVWITQ